MDACFTQDTLHMERKTGATDARFKNHVARSKAKFGYEKTRILASNGLGSTHHASAQFRKPRRHTEDLFLPDGDATTNGDFVENLEGIENAKTLDFLLFILQFNDVGFAVIFNQHGPFRRSHNEAHKVVGVKVRLEATNVGLEPLSGHSATDIEACVSYTFQCVLIT